MQAESAVIPVFTTLRTRLLLRLLADRNDRSFKTLFFVISCELSVFYFYPHRSGGSGNDLCRGVDIACIQILQFLLGDLTNLCVRHGVARLF